MTYRLKRREPVGGGLRRIAREQADEAVAAATGDGPLDDRVHDARTCCKKLRGLLRLVRPHLDETYRVENAFLRDLARPLSATRDAGVVRAAFEKLARDGRLESDVADAIRAALPAAPSGGDCRLAAFAESMRAFRDRIDAWPVLPGGFAALRCGLTDTYRRGREAMGQAADDGGDEERHDWRKQAKYHWYHVRLLRNVWVAEMRARAKGLERLSDLLGDDHDLAVLRAAVGSAADLDPGHRESAVALIDRRRADLSAEACPLGARLYAEKPEPFAKRVRRYWKTWRATGD